ncbi:MAG: hypothetical protein PHP57_10815 [Sideroxydans sp.]|nr:hypothetical protein [Sideroxydans sp.]
MAFPWLVVLQNIPWGEVMKNAPKVSEGAKKLWGTVRGKTVVAEVSSPSVSPHSIESLQTRLGKLEGEIVDLHQQMLASSELIKTLAEQNTRLIERVETNRRRVIGLTVVVCLLAGWVFFAQM